MISRLSCLFLLLPLTLPAATLRDFIDQYTADSRLLERHWSINSDSQAARNRAKKLLETWKQRLAALDFSRLPQDEQIDWLLLNNHLTGELHYLQREDTRAADLQPWLPFQQVIDTLTDALVHGQPVNAEKAAAALAPLAKSTKDLTERLQKAKEKQKPEEKAAEALPTPHQAFLAARATDTAREALKSWYENYQDTLPGFSWWTQQPYETTSKALEEHAKFLRETLAGIKEKDENPPLLGQVVGEAVLKQQLAQEFIPYSPEALIGIAEREFAWCEEQMKQATREWKKNEDWLKALREVKQQHVPAGEQEVFVRDECQRAIDFVKQHRLVTVPADCEEWWGTRMLSAKEQRSVPYAAYNGHDVLIAFASGSMSHEDKLMSMRGNNKPFMRIVVPHELIPGHHLQTFMAARYRPYRREFGTPFFIEGWALYWEMRLWDLRYPTTPTDRIGALFWRMHRCARIIVTLKYHLGQMQPEEMVKFLVDRVGHETLGATSEVRRFIQGDYPPLYQCAYMLGGLQLRALHREMTRDGGMSEQAFHDAVLRLGPIPVELIRAHLRKLPLSADYTSQWRFDDAR